jgi:carbon-monoxide dehydrogenase iron sulfur subunit
MTLVKRIAAHPAKCTACRTCELACAMAHVDTNDLVEAIYKLGAKPRIYIEAADGLTVPLQCRHCDDAPCVMVCPTGALSRASQAEPVVANQDKCIGCEYCVQACPFGVIVLAKRPDAAEAGKVIIKCDLCAQRLAEGLEPACVSSCPTGALTYKEMDESARRARARMAAITAAAEVT